ncbi:hypothetical protein LJB91_01110 [Bacteroidales bacterium OttesenSCG-928-L03]|nr:hypothetical protein [Bacteroidales bacterium OttesenSCG-928-L03]
MKPKSLSKLSTWVLWLCMAITLLVFGAFYTLYNRDETVEPGLILHWLYVLLALVTLAVALFSLVRTVRRWREKPRSIFGQIIWLVVLVGILAISYAFGDGHPLIIPGYSGHENTVFWLRLTDMWIFSLYVLLGLNVVAVFFGILWSYLKRTR